MIFLRKNLLNSGLQSGSADDGITLIDNYKARVFTCVCVICCTRIALGIHHSYFRDVPCSRRCCSGRVSSSTDFRHSTLVIEILWGPIIDRYQFEGLGKRRPWILIAQTGMILILASMFFIPNPSENVNYVAYMFFIYNIFTSLQDVSTDALAVDILRSNEFEKVNSYMFTSKSVGAVIGGAGLGTIIGIVGIKGAILLQIPILVLIMMVPLFMTERPGERRFPWEEKAL